MQTLIGKFKESVGMKKKAKALPADQQARLTDFLKARIKADSLVVVWR